MKKLISAVLAFAVTASMAITCFAADMNVTLTNNKKTTELSAGDKVRVTVNLGSGFTSFELSVAYNVDAFTFNKGGKSSSDLDASPEYNAKDGKVTIAYATGNNETATVIEEEEDEEGNITETERAAKNTFYLEFIVNEGAAGGSYDFTLTQTAEQGRGTTDENDNKMNVILGDPTTVTVKSSYVANALVQNTPATNDAVDGYYTQGFSGTITPNNDSVSGVSFTLTDSASGNTYDDSISWDAITGASAVTYGINVLNVPVGVTVSISNVASTVVAA